MQIRGGFAVESADVLAEALGFDLTHNVAGSWTVGNGSYGGATGDVPNCPTKHKLLQKNKFCRFTMAGQTWPWTAHRWWASATRSPRSA